MRMPLMAALLAIIAGPLQAHPGTGITVDAEGNVVFAFGPAAGPHGGLFVLEIVLRPDRAYEARVRGIAGGRVRTLARVQHRRS